MRTAANDMVLMSNLCMRINGLAWNSKAPVDGKIKNNIMLDKWEMNNNL